VSRVVLVHWHREEGDRRDVVGPAVLAPRREAGGAVDGFARRARIP
jgi:hypothetical protein